MGLILFIIFVLRRPGRGWALKDETVTWDDFPGTEMNSLKKTSCRKQKKAKSSSVNRTVDYSEDRGQQLVPLRPYLRKIYKTLTSLCGFCDAYGRCEHGRTHKNVHGLIPIGGQHQHHCCRSRHTLLWADRMFPRGLFLLNQVDTSRFTEEYRWMHVHGGWYHIWVRDSSYGKKNNLHVVIVERGSLDTFWCICMCVCLCACRPVSETVQWGPLRISYLQCINPLNIS